MNVKPREIIIDENAPFKNDVFDSLSRAKILTELISSQKAPFVLSINSPWGTGKTTFAKMWKQYLHNNDFSCLYFNAWESDFYSDPLIPLIGEIQSQIISNLGEDSKAREYFEKAKNIGGGLLRRAIPVAIKIATAGVVDLGDVTEELLKEVSEIAEEKINSYEEDKKTINRFRENLKKFAEEISSKEDKPIVFFIDELDRCRPDYAIELLERIKHLFNVPGFVYIMILDIEQMESAVKTLYGISMKFDGYVRRFIDLQYKLPKASTNQFCNYLFESFGFKDYFRERHNGQAEIKELLDTLISLFDIFEFSLRTQEQCFTQLSIALQTFPPNRSIFAAFLSFLISLKTYDRNLFFDYVDAKISAKDITDVFRKNPKGKEFLYSTYGKALEAYLVSAHANHQTMNEKISEYDLEANDENNSEEIRKRSGSIARILSGFYTRDLFNFIGDLGNKINLLEGFKTLSGE